MIRTATLIAGVAIAAAVACKSSSTDEAPDEKAPSEAEPAKQVDSGAPPEAAATASPGAAMLAWLDPEAVTVMYVDLPAELDVDLLSAVFAVPPKIARMLRDARGVDEALDAVLEADAPRPSEWLGNQALASSSVVGSGTYVLRPMTKPAAEVEATLTESGMQKDEAEGITILLPRGRFPWKVAFLDDTVLAFIPVREIGTGLSPLTAGRDMPASPVELQLQQVLDRKPTPLLGLYAAGPLLHLDLGQDVGQFELLMLPMPNKGIDVQLLLHPMRDADAAADGLKQRDLDLETDQVQAIAKRVAFTLEGPAVAGRLQLSAEDLSALAGT